MALKYKHTILLVDDETSITKALKRLFRKEGYLILTASCGQEGLEILKKTERPVSLIISDQRMPKMMGALFLEKARKIFPDSIRFLLTGYSDMDAVVDAVNKGEIHRYLTKPWNDSDLLLKVRQSLEQYELAMENKRLLALTAKQNKELNKLNKSLEKKVKARTREIITKNRELEDVNKKLEESFMGTIRLLSSMIERINPWLGQYTGEVTRLTRAVAEEYDISDEKIERIEIAAMIHDIGMLGLPEKIMMKEEQEMTEEEFVLYSQHPLTGHICLESVDRLNDVGNIVLYHHERIDGSGFPKGLKGDDIPVGSRIIGVVSDYCRVINIWPKDVDKIIQKARRYFGSSIKNFLIDEPKELLSQVAKKLIILGSNNKYDIEAVSILIKKLGEKEIEEARKRKTYIQVSLGELKEGMILGKTLLTHDGRMLLNKGAELKERSIESLQELGRRDFIKDKIWIMV